MRKKAEIEIPERIIKRDPLTHLRKRICGIISDNKLTEEQKEQMVLQEIESYREVISQSR